MATQEVAIRAQQPLSRFEQREVIDTIKQTVCKGATDAQLRMFLEVCKATGLDPFLKEIWYVAEKGIIMAARDGYLRVANENPMFDGIETRVERDDKKVPIKAVCTVWRKDRNHPTICEAYFSEYNKQSPVWKQYPSAMISKVAEVLALKRSFAINGVVTEEEIGEQAPRMPQVTEPPAAPEILPPEGKLISLEEFRTSNRTVRLDAFERMRGAIGDEQYYRILGVLGVEQATQFSTLGDAVKAYNEMLETYQFATTARPV